MEQINYEAEVRKVYTKAKCRKAEFGYVILSAFMEGLSFEEESESKAWRSAYEKLVSQHKIVNQNKSK